LGGTAIFRVHIRHGYRDDGERSENFAIHNLCEFLLHWRFAVAIPNRRQRERDFAEYTEQFLWIQVKHSALMECSRTAAGASANSGRNQKTIQRKPEKLSPDGEQ